MSSANVPSWVQDAIFYQIFPDRFARSGRTVQPAHLEPWDAPPTAHGYKGGDLAGIQDKLDWLTGLGVTAIYLNPIFQSGSNHRYHTHDYHEVDPLLGGNEAFDAFLAACHDRGIRVVLDGVFNHASRGFLQFHDLLENGPDSPYVDWFHVNSWPLHPYDPKRPAGYDAWWGLKALPKFNTDNPEVREFLMGVAEHWARKGIDGWRLDVPEEITTAGFWEEFRSRVKAINPDLYIVGEIWTNASEFIAGGDRFDATMNYLFTAPTIAFAGGRSVVVEVAEGVPYEVTPPLDAGLYGDAMERLLGMYPEAATLANFNLLGSHDTPRFLTLAGGDRRAVSLGALLLFTFPGTPSIYYGDEVGLAGGRDPDCRRAFPWHDADSWDSEILDTYRSLIALRRDHPALRSPGYRRLWPPSGEPGFMLYLFVRESEDELLLIAANAGDATETASLSQVDFPITESPLLWGRGEIDRGENSQRIIVPPRSGAVWRIVR
jgi:glycosidase